MAFAYGPRGQEVFAGWAGWTKGLEYQGIKCNEPIEYFEDPLKQKGYKPEHDTRDPKVRARLLGLAGAPPGPDVPNAWQLGVVCTSFCDHQITNGGTRSWDNPEGDGSRPSEVQGNEDAEFAAKLCTTLDENGRVWGIESSAPSGRYPKLWDLPCMKKLRERTGAKIVPLAMCAWGLAPPDAPSGEYHRKLSWWLVSKELYPWALLFLAKPCPGVSKDHTHVQLKGPSPLPGVPLTRVAQQYAPALCAAWGLVIKAAYEQWDWPTYLQEKSSLQALKDCWGELSKKPWPTDKANQLHRTLGAPPTTAGGGSSYATCTGCGLEQRNWPDEPCPVCQEEQLGGGRDLFPLQLPADTPLTERVKCWESKQDQFQRAWRIVIWTSAKSPTPTKQ